MNKIECHHCKNASLAFDNFMDLSVPITKHASVEQCLAEFIKPERMEVCGYKCSKCKRDDGLHKDMTIYRLPDILVVHLKRFSSSYYSRSKINT